MNHKTPNRSIYEYKHGIQIKPKKYADFFENVIINYAHNKYKTPESIKKKKMKLKLERNEDTDEEVSPAIKRFRLTMR